MRINISKLFAVILLEGCLLSAAMGARAASSQDDPLLRVKQGIGQIVALFQNKQMPLQERREKLRAMAAAYFDFEDMAKSALGYHWRDLTPSQRAEFVPVFTGFIEDAYLSKLEDYSVQRIRNEANAARVDYVSERFEETDYAEVVTNVTLPDQKDPVTVNYEMHRRDGIWRVYDLSIDSISVIENYRNQFNRVINNDGYDQLVAELRVKQEQFRAYMDHPAAAPVHH